MLELIQGGRAKPAIKPGDVEAKLRQLRVIDIAMIRSSRAPNTGPRFIHALATGVVVWAALLGAFGLAEHAGVLVWSAIPSSIVRQSLLLSPFALGVAAYLWVDITSPHPKTWADLVYTKFAEYEPVDKGAYRRLRQLTRDAGILDSNQVREWVMIERRAVRVVSGRLEPEREAFLRRI